MVIICSKYLCIVSNEDRQVVYNNLFFTIFKHD